MRRVTGLIVGFALFLPGPCDSGAGWHSTDVSGSFPWLSLTMTRLADGKQVTAADYRGQIVMLYFVVREQRLSR